MMKATHQGSCQLCGRLQRLPNGKLAKHGYTVEFNFFNGVCPGSHNLPYEQSCDLLPAQRDHAKATAKSMTKFAAETRALRDPKAVWIHERTFDRGYGRSTYAWKQVEVSFEGHDLEYSGAKYYTATYSRVDRDGIAKVETIQTYGVNSIDDIIAKQNGARANEIAGNAKRFADYAVWAQKRIDAWKIAPLTPIKDGSDGVVESGKINSTKSEERSAS